MFQIRLLLAAPMAAVFLTACVVAPAPRPVVYSQPVPAGPAYAPPPAPVEQEYVVNVPPPAPYVEAVPPVPFVGAVWIGGYWGWNGSRHYWIPGRYEHARPGYAWRPHAWVQEGGRWRMHAGAWERR